VTRDTLIRYLEAIGQTGYDLIIIDYSTDGGEAGEFTADQIATLTDLGPTSECATQATTGRTKPLSFLRQGSRLIIEPQGKLTAGHRFLLELRADQITTTASDGSTISYGTLTDAPTQFFFATRPISGEPIGGMTGAYPTGVVDLLEFGTLVMTATDSGHLIAVDTTVADSTGYGAYPVHAIKTVTEDGIRNLATDGHNRLFYSSQQGYAWEVHNVRVEDVRQAEQSACGDPNQLPGWASGAGCFQALSGGVRTAMAVGFALPGMTASEWMASGNILPVAAPVDMEILSEDEVGSTLELASFYSTYNDSGTPEPPTLDDLEPDDQGVYSVSIPLESTYKRATDGEPEPSTGQIPEAAWRGSACLPDEEAHDRYQRVSIDNLTTGQTWSLDIENPWLSAGGFGTTTVEIRARRGDEQKV
jgi:hypothetical protein